MRRLDGVVSVSVPEEEKEEPEATAPGGESEVRESIRIQALDGGDVPLLDGLPLNYDVKSHPWRGSLLKRSGLPAT